MKPRLIVIFVLIVVLPLAILVWFGVRVARTEREMVSHKFREILLSKLSDVAGDVAGLVAQRERDLLAQAPISGHSPDELREAAARNGTIRQFFVLDPAGAMIYPVYPGPLSNSEKAFLERTQQIWLQGEIPAPAKESVRQTSGVSQKTVSVPAPGKMLQFKPDLMPPTSDKGWYAWHWGSDIDLIFWWREDSGSVAGAELNVARFMADLIGVLPETNPVADASSAGRVALLDSNGSAIYQWGAYQPSEPELPLASLDLSAPLSSWRLVHYGPDASAGQNKGMLFNLLSGVAAFGAALIGLAFYYYRENARAMREAAQRVSFVNQVSHELRTPLTNIRMYAEILEGEIDEREEKARAHLNVIVSESRRLSRLIGNVLTFSRKQRSALRLHPSMGNVDAAIGAVLEQFKAPLEAKGVAIAFFGSAPEPASFDRDALEQILGNLLSNVEKYAASGTRVDVTSRQDGDTVSITVADDGPGIPPRERQRIFEPFYRVSNKLTDGVAGTGMGLAIARDLARLHGGDLTLEPTGTGACFKLIVQAPRAVHGESS